MKETRNKLIVIAGPTAVGKTSLAIELAQHFNTEIISCDSRQVFSELNIGVARPSSEELDQVKHHLIAHRSIHEEYNAGIFADEVNALLHQLFEHHPIVIMTGGTGLYIKAVLHGLDYMPKKNETLRQQLKLVLESQGLEGLHRIAQERGLDINTLENQNPQRVMRAIEIAVGEPSQHTAVSPPEYDALCFYINRDRAELYDRINRRVDLMLEEGLEKEAESLLPHQELNALQTVGYKELFEYFNGNWTREKAIEKIKQHSRNYAKRQLTWFRNQNFQEVEPTLQDLLKRLP